MNSKRVLFIAALLGGLSVFLGAFGAHALKPMLEANHRTDTYELAVRYQFLHSLALLFLGLWMERSETKLARWSVMSFILGIVLFSGSLYSLSFTNNKVFAMATPIGGLFFLMGWGMLAVNFAKKKNR